jgi:hypothetical protein
MMPKIPTLMSGYGHLGMGTTAYPEVNFANPIIMRNPIRW